MTADVGAGAKTTVGPYTLVRLVGRGGCGAVYEAERHGRRVALKLLDAVWAANADVVRRFAREARAAAAIRSEHVVAVLDAGTETGRPFLVMELLEGEDLGRLLARVRRVPVATALHVITQVLEGLACAHAAGVVHRDLKPDNVFLTAKGGDPHFVKILDFGMSKRGPRKDGTAPLALTRVGAVIGTPMYVAPEQARGDADVDARADLYGVGAILFECLTGRPPHVGETDEQVLLSICTNDPPDLGRYLPDPPPALSAFVKKALARDRGARFQSAAEMLLALRAIMTRPPATRAAGRGRAVFLAAALGAIAGGTIALAVLEVWGEGRGDRRAVDVPRVDPDGGPVYEAR